MSRHRVAGLGVAAWRGLVASPHVPNWTQAPQVAAAASAQARWRSAAAGPSPSASASASAAAAPSTSEPAADPGSEFAVYAGQTLAAIRARIFGTHLGDGRPTGRKLLRKPLIGPAVAAYYPPDPAALDPLFVDVDDTRRVAKLERMKRRGKAPPKKGEGKRAGRKKR
jgi:small subunit ribosomal protein S33